MEQGIISFGIDTIAVKVFGLLQDAGYWVKLEKDFRGFTLTWAVPPKGYLNGLG